ncbi:MAG: nitroreductase family protein [Anaeroplasmataceae bacterium]
MEKGYFEVLNERFSCRSFADKPIEKEILNKLLSVVKLAPSACNFEPVKVIVIDDKEMLEKLSTATKYLFNAKTVLMVCYDNTKSWHRRRDNKDHGIVDSTIVATYLMQTCYALGLGTTYVCAFNDELCHEIFNIPSNLCINCLLPIGYMADDVKPQEGHFIRKELEELVSFNEFK